MQRVQRYEWDDALVEAQRDGFISNGALLLCLKLSKAITWEPKDKMKPSGLYWANEEALWDVGASRSTYFRYRQSLLETGFFAIDRGNLIPQVPDLSLLEAEESLPETDLSLGEIEKSLDDNPYSVDTCSVDIYSDNSFTVGTTPQVAGPKRVVSFIENRGNPSKLTEEGGLLCTKSSTALDPSLFALETSALDRVANSSSMKKDRTPEQAPLSSNKTSAFKAFPDGASPIEKPTSVQTPLLGVETSALDEFVSLFSIEKNTTPDGFPIRDDETSALEHAIFSARDPEQVVYLKMMPDMVNRERVSAACLDVLETYRALNDGFGRKSIEDAQGLSPKSPSKDKGHGGRGRQNKAQVPK